MHHCFLFASLVFCSQAFDLVVVAAVPFSVFAFFVFILDVYCLSCWWCLLFSE